jgi:uncharacterized membrane protein
MERCKRIPFLYFHVLAKFHQFKLNRLMRSISNASALAHGANDSAFPLMLPLVLPSHRTSLMVNFLQFLSYFALIFLVSHAFLCISKWEFFSSHTC